MPRRLRQTAARLGFGKAGGERLHAQARQRRSPDSRGRKARWHAKRAHSGDDQVSRRVEQKVVSASEPDSQAHERRHRAPARDPDATRPRGSRVSTGTNPIARRVSE